MNYRDADLIDALAAEYVLGTLQSRARDRFEALLRDSPAVRAAVWHWESQLGALGSHLRPVEPPMAIWQAIARRIAPPRTISSLRGTRFWQGCSAFATAAALTFAVLLTSVPTEHADRVALFANTQQAPQWLVSIDSRSGRLTSRALNTAAVQADRDYELWMLPGAGAPPRSLGVLPANGHTLERDLPASMNQSLRATATLAISLEPTGGSPTGAPTGPVLFQAQLFEL